MATLPRSIARISADTDALLGLLADGGSLADLYGLTEQELEGLYAFGLAHYRQARYAQAAKIFARLVAMHHGEPRYLNALAAAHQMQGRHEQALHFYGVSQLLDPSDPVPTFHTAHSLLALGWQEDAREALQLVIQQADGEPRHAALGERARALLNLVSGRDAATPTQ